MAPPSFDSFPDLNPPQASTSTTISSSKSSRDNSSKRPRANDFLKGIESELKGEGKKLRKVKKEDRIVTAISTKGKEKEVDSWYSDQKGDELNVKYGSLHKGDVPKYRRLGGGRVVGLNSGLRITKETAYSGRGLEIDRSGRVLTPRYIDPRSLSHLNSRQLKRVILLPSTSAISPSMDPFLPDSIVFDSTRFVSLLPEQSMHSKLESLEFEKDQDYRSIAGMVKPEDLVDAEEAVESEFDIGGKEGESIEEITKKKLVEFDREVRKDPGNASKWIEFVDYQEQVSLSASGGRFSGNETTTEIKLSILDRAFTYPQNKNSVELILVYLKTIEEVWTAKKVLSKWLQFLEEHSQDISLWIAYINYRQGNSATFNTRDLVDVYTDCFKILISQFESGRASGGLESIESNLIYLFQRCCLMLRQAGFNERALAAYQAIIDLNFFSPVSPKVSNSKLMEKYEDFWDAEGPRIGESGAVGWSEIPSNKFDSAWTPAAPVKANEEEDKYTQWATLESMQTGPARTTDEGIDEDIDPYRCILFDDIKDFLFLLSNSTSKLLLVYSFLQFLGIPFLPNGKISSNSKQEDSFIQTQFFENSHLKENFWIPFGQVTLEDSIKLEDTWAFRDSPCAMETVFEILKPADLEALDCPFIRRVFEILWPVLKDDFFTLHSIAFEAALSHKDAIKLAKTILRTNRSNLLLWDGYARLELARGKTEVARGVYVTALTLGEGAGEDKIQLWRSWAEMEMKGGRENLVLKIVIEGAGVGISNDFDTLATVDVDVRPSSSTILRAIQHYKSTLSSTLSLSTLYLLSLLTYLTQPQSNSLSASLEILQSYIKTLSAYDLIGTVQHEIALQLMTTFITMDSGKGKGGFKPIIGREIYSQGIKSFRFSSKFLLGLLEGEARMKIQNHVRKVINEELLSTSNQCSQSYLFAIYAETTLSTNSIYRVRALFDRAVANPSVKKSASIWKMYIEFEIKNGDSARVKRLIFRSISECPWCKEFYLLPFSSELRSLFNLKELKLFYLGLLEKGLRAKVEIEFEESQIGGVDDIEEAEGEVELLFEGRKRLMPF